MCLLPKARSVSGARVESFSAFLPIDRLLALATGSPIPTHGQGAALFADLSGFMPLTERLVREFGEQGAAEVLTDTLNTVFEELIHHIHDFGGTIISFAGDAITCWFDDLRPASATISLAPGAARAAGCAQALQAAMAQFVDLQVAAITVQISLKVVITAGAVRRFVVGDPQIQQFDLLVGAPVDRLARGGAFATPGAIIVDATAAAQLALQADFGPALMDPNGERFQRLSALRGMIIPAPWPNLAATALSSALIQPWVFPAVAERLHTDGAFLTELRPATVLFLRFSAIDYTGDEEAAEWLDRYIRNVQQTLLRYGAALHQIIIGDKGCYLYAVCGAPIAYEDDALRVATAAVILRDLATAELRTLQIGIASGRVRAGSYGAHSRRTYGVIGDVVNLAARLMGRATEGEVLVDGRARAAASDGFSYEPRPPVALKGRAEPLPVFALTGLVRRRASRLTEPAYTLPLIGRDADVARITALFNLALSGHGQVVTLAGDAGIGKSRLAAEVVRLAQRRNSSAYGGAGQSSGQHSPYLAWQPIFQAILGVNPDLPLHRQLRWLADELGERAPKRVDLLPLLGPVLDLPLADNDTTAALDAKARKGVLEAVLVELIESAAHEAQVGGGALVVLLEDLHWLDPLSADLLVLITRAALRLPIVLVLTTRPDERTAWLVSIANLTYATTLQLEALDDRALEGLVRAKLAQLYPARAEAPPRHLLTRLSARAQGNPFYIEELLNYVHDCGVDPYNLPALDALALPDTLHRLVLARIDQLSVREQTTLRVASVIGRQFLAAWLPGYAPELGASERIRADLERLAYVELTPMAAPEPELAYLFKHIVTQEVAYTSLPASTRRRLHTQLARWLEATLPDDPPLDVLAFHYDHGNNAAKRREYLRRAGDAARKAYANAAAAAYYARLLELEKKPQTRSEVQRLLGEVQFELGQFDAAQGTFAQAAETALSHGDHRGQAESLSRQGRALIDIGDYSTAEAALNTALALAEQLHNETEQLRATRYLGGVAMAEGRTERARHLLTTSLEQSRKLSDRHAEISISVNLGTLAFMGNDRAGAQAHFQTALALAEAQGDRWHVAVALANLGELAARAGHLEEARSHSRRSVGADREIGNRAGVSLSLVNLADMACAAHDLAEASALLREALPLSLLGGGAFIPLCVLYVIARVQILEGSAAPAAALLRLAVQHPAGTEDLQMQARELAGLAGLDLTEPAPTLEESVAAAERWLVEHER